MAKLSRIARRLRLAFELEHPAAQLDDNIVEYFANMLEDDTEDEDTRVEVLAEAWSPFLLQHTATFDNDAATREVCRAVLRRIHSNDGCSGASSPVALSRQSSASRALPTTSSAASIPAGSTGGGPALQNGAAGSSIEVWGLMEWLQRLSLAHYAASAKAWCEELGARDVEEVIENYEEFCNELKLKPLERRRVLRDCGGDDVADGGTAANGADRRPSLASDTGVRPTSAMPPAAFQALAPAPNAGPSSALLRDGFEPCGAPPTPGGADAPHLAVSGFPPQRMRGHRCERFGPPDDPYTLLHEIGAGVTATVYKCTRGEDVFAAKAITLSRFKLERDFAAEVEKLHRESEILYTLRHPQIVSLYDVIETPEKLYLVMEFVDGCELLDHIRRNGRLLEHEARYVFLQLALGLRYIHSKGVVHRDLKPQNILVDREASRPDLLEVKISDFGHSKLVNDGYDTARTQVGTPRFWAPEVAERSGLSYDQRVDLWSLGVVLFFMLEGRCPFDGVEEAFEVPFTDQSKTSKEARDLVKGLIRLRPHERLSLDECISHPWVILEEGPLSRIVRLYEDAQTSLRGERERRAVLPRDPQDVRALRRDLQSLTLRFKFPARLRRREVALCFGSATEDKVDAAWDALLTILERHFPGVKCQRLDNCPPAVSVMSASLPPVAEAATEAAAADEDSPLGTEVFEDHDAELAELLAAASQPAAPPGGAAAAAPSNGGSGSTAGEWVVTAPVGEWAPVPRQAEFRLREGRRVLKVSVQLPSGYPSVEAPEVTAVTFDDREGGGLADAGGSVASAARETGPPAVPVQELRARIEGHVAQTFGRQPCLLELLSWLRRDEACAAVVAGGSIVSSTSDAGAAPGDSEEVRCGRVCFMTHHHDDRVDMHGLCTTKGGPMKRQSLYGHLRSSCGEVSGFLSFGKPGILFAEGPLSAVEKLLAEVEKFPSWWDAQEKFFHRRNISDLSAWRAFKDFAKVRTEELRDIFDAADRSDLYEEVMAGTSMDPKKKPTKGRHR